MSYKPSDLAIGIRDILGILLPGAILTYVLSERFSYIIGNIFPPVEDVIPLWVKFLIASYILGHILIFLGKVLDEKMFFPMAFRIWKKSMKKKLLIDKVVSFMKEDLGEDLDKCDYESWIRGYIIVNSPAATGELERLEANSNFFRSMTLVFLCLVIELIVKNAWLAASTGFLLLLLFTCLYLLSDKENAIITAYYFIILKKNEKSRAS